MQPSDDEELPKLVNMANQIAAFFRPYPPAEAEAGIRDHMAAFWTPHMRNKLRTAPAAAVARLDPVAAIVARPGASQPRPAHRNDTA